jgi:cardiolipin synthase
VRRCAPTSPAPATRSPPIHELWTWLILAFITFLYGAGIVCAIEAVITARTPQGSIAWALSLLAIPILALPLYLVFGRSAFRGYVEAMRAAQHKGRGQIETLLATSRTFDAKLPPERENELKVFERLSLLPFLTSNAPKLLIDGEATFAAVFESIRNAKSYILVQSFIIHADRVGNELKDLLVARAKEGVKIHVLYDEMGSRSLSRAWSDELRAAGAQVTPFGATRGRHNRFQVNFRNHRKIIVVDGVEAFIGGLNVGDEYLGRSARFGHWRDTHLAVRGPLVQPIQLSFIMDWFWATRKLPELDWAPRPADRSGGGGNVPMLFVPTGPADRDNDCEIMVLQAIAIARRRLWIASPYFVPSQAVLEGLRLAAMRGVDVRILLPSMADHALVYLAGFLAVEHARRAGVNVYRYRDGFLHQKVWLVDDDLAAVGTVNLDNRSLRLNFELTAWAADKGFASEVAAMLEKDFAGATLVEAEELQQHGRLFRAGAMIARLFEPVL